MLQTGLPVPLGCSFKGAFCPSHTSQQARALPPGQAGPTARHVLWSQTFLVPQPGPHRLPGTPHRR